MKALFSRMRHGKPGAPSKDKDSPIPWEKAHPPLPADVPVSSTSLPDVSVYVEPPVVMGSNTVDPHFHGRPAPSPSPGSTTPSSARVNSAPDSEGRSSRSRMETDSNNPSHPGDAGVSKKVAFVSPPSTPATDPSADPVNPGSFASRTSASSAPLPAFRSTSAAGGPRLTSDSQRSTTSLGSRHIMPLDVERSAVNDRPSSNDGHSQSFPASPRPFAASPIFQDSYSVRSGSPLSHFSTRTGIQAAASWSEAAEDELVSNLGPRERTRQEVLWEIVASEDRYVVELLKLKDTFIDPLLHPFSSIPSVSPNISDPADDYYYTPDSRPAFPDGLDDLPIASRFLSTNPAIRAARQTSGPTLSQNGPNRSRTPVIPPADGESSDDDGDQLGRGYAPGKNKVPMRLAASSQSPYGSSSATRAKASRTTLPFPTRSHHSLPPPPRTNLNNSTTSLGKQSIHMNADSEKKSSPTSRLGKKLHKKNTSASESGAHQDQGLAPHLLPADLRECLEVLESGILNGHLTLSEGLRKRYEEQYPLVRSLADVFVSNSHILRGYATYVLHLERALEQVDNALSTANLSKKPRKQDSADWIHVSNVLKRLEDIAAEKGETGLAISLSKPFQRLLKYPLLFQNLLFHTDPSTFEYESTLHMVAEVETIVRSIEDEKIQKEERDKTRDAMARIDGLDKNKALAAPKPSRQLIQERLLVAPTSPSSHPKSSRSTTPVPSTSGTAKTVQQKSSFKRLSDVLQSGTSGSGVGGKKDIWLVVFNDVVLRCQRTGTTTLPLVSSTNARSHSLPDLQAKSKYSTVGRRPLQTKPRNLYKFIKIETWTIGDIAKPRMGVVSMEDITRTRSEINSAKHEPIQEPLVEEETVDSDSDGKSKMSFSYWGAEKITIRAPVKPRGSSATKSTSQARRPGNAPTSYSIANAKFGTRLRSPEPSDPNHPRPGSRRQAATPNPPSVQSHRKPTEPPASGTKLPAWGSPGAARSASTPVPGTTKRTQKLSAPSTPVQATRLVPIKTGSPAPSELTQDSGVGFYREMMARNPSIERLT